MTLSLLPDMFPQINKFEVDVIFTHTFHASCCLACKAGLLYGIQSGKTPCRYHDKKWHKMFFVDNDYFDYDHQKHLDYVAKYQPKYATTRDMMTKSQCDEIGIKYYSFDDIMRQAEEIAKHAENVILIPKYDCLHEIDNSYILGYSVPTSHGGTPLPIRKFADFRVHLLGGSWKKQLNYFGVIPDSVVSMDNNDVSKIAQHGGVILPDGNRRDLNQLGISKKLKNSAYVAFAISVGNMQIKIQELKNETKNRSD